MYIPKRNRLNNEKQIPIPHSIVSISYTVQEQSHWCESGLSWISPYIIKPYGQTTGRLEMLLYPLTYLPRYVAVKILCFYCYPHCLSDVYQNIEIIQQAKPGLNSWVHLNLHLLHHSLLQTSFSHTKYPNRGCHSSNASGQSGALCAIVI